MLVEVPVTSCLDCPYHTKKQVYTADSFEFVFTLSCRLENKVISKYVETFDKVQIPNFCPFKTKENDN